MKGVYRLTNTITGDFYIGQSVDVEKRRAQHFSKCDSKHKHHLLYADIVRYGKDAFLFEVIAQVDDDAERLNMERELIKSLQPLYNSQHTAKYHLPAETRKHLSECGKRQWAKMTDEQRSKVIKEQLIGPGKGHPVSDATRKKLREANLGKVMPESTRRKISLSNKGKNDNKSHWKTVVALLDGEVKFMFNSVKAAGEYFGVNPSCITGALKGRRKHCRGYEWKYYKDWSVETSCDECSSVGVISSHVEVRGSLLGEEIVRSAEMENQRVIR